MKFKLCFLFLLISLSARTQTTINGKVIDSKTQLPIENVAVYFNNTTIGTTTNEKGVFSISYSDVVKSNLVISYLGYEKVYINNYKSKAFITVELIEAKNELDEVVISYDDGLTRKQKLKLFRTHFLGQSKNGKSCKILNEDDLILRYHGKDKTLSASANVPLVIVNQKLQYLITYELIDFEVVFNYVDAKTNEFNYYSVSYLGASFYKDLNKKNKSTILKRRLKSYNGSTQHLLRSIYNENLASEGFQFFNNRGFKIDEKNEIKIKKLDSLDIAKVQLKKDLSILFDKKEQSKIISKSDYFFVDKFGNYHPTDAIYFSGVMGSKGLGDTLPLDYKLNTK